MIDIENETRVGRPNDPKCDPTAKSVPERAAAWAAGVLEGRGSFNFTPTGVRLVVQMSPGAALDRLRKYFGGTVVPFNTTFRWTLTGGRVWDMMRHLRPFLTRERRIEINHRLNGLTTAGSSEEKENE